MAKKKKDYQRLARELANRVPYKLEIQARRKALEDKSSFVYKATKAAACGNTNRELRPENILKTVSAQNGGNRIAYKYQTGGMGTTSRARGVDGRNVRDSGNLISKGTANFSGNIKGKEKRSLKSTIPRGL